MSASVLTSLFARGYWRKLGTLVLLAAEDAAGTGILGSHFSVETGICHVFLGGLSGPTKHTAYFQLSNTGRTINTAARCCQVSVSAPGAGVCIPVLVLKRC